MIKILQEIYSFVVYIVDKYLICQILKSSSIDLINNCIYELLVSMCQLFLLLLIQTTN